MEKKIIVLLISLVFFVSMPLYAAGVTTNSGSAPIGGGLFILLGLGAAYAGKKIYDYKKQEPEA